MIHWVRERERRSEGDRRKERKRINENKTQETKKGKRCLTTDGHVWKDDIMSFISLFKGLSASWEGLSSLLCLSYFILLQYSAVFIQIYRKLNLTQQNIPQMQVSILWCKVSIRGQQVKQWVAWGEEGSILHCIMISGAGGRINKIMEHFMGTNRQI